MIIIRHFTVWTHVLDITFLANVSIKAVEMFYCILSYSKMTKRDRQANLVLNSLASNPRNNKSFIPSDWTCQWLRKVVGTQLTNHSFTISSSSRFHGRSIIPRTDWWFRRNRGKGRSRSFTRRREIWCRLIICELNRNHPSFFGYLDQKLIKTLKAVLAHFTILRG